MVVPVVHSIDAPVWAGTEDAERWSLLDYALHIDSGELSLFDYDEEETVEVDLGEAIGLDRSAIEELDAAHSGNGYVVRLGTEEGRDYYYIGEKYEELTEQYGVGVANEEIGEYL